MKTPTTTAKLAAALAAATTLGLGLGAATAAASPPATTATSAPARPAAPTAGGLGASPAPGSPDLAPHHAYFSLHLAPGQSFTGKVLVVNDSTATIPVKVGGVPGLTSPNGSGAVYANTPGGDGRWITTQASSELVPPRSRSDLSFTLTVPAKVTPGDHLAGVTLTEVPKALAKAKGKVSMQVQVVSRIVIGVLVRVPGPAAFTAAVGHPSVAKGPEGIGEVLTPIVDTGRLLAQPHLAVSITTAHGTRTISRQTGTILPTGHEEVPTYWPTPLSGKVHIRSCVYGAPLAHAVCAASLVDLTQPTIVAPKPGQIEKVVVHSGLSTGLLIALVAGAIVLVGLLVLLAVLLTGRRRAGAHSAKPTA